MLNLISNNHTKIDTKGIEDAIDNGLSEISSTLDGQNWESYKTITYQWRHKKTGEIVEYIPDEIRPTQKSIDESTKKIFEKLKRVFGQLNKGKLPKEFYDTYVQERLCDIPSSEDLVMAGIMAVLDLIYSDITEILKREETEQAKDKIRELLTATGKGGRAK